MIEDVISFDGHTFAGDYEIDFVQGTQPALPPAKIATLQRIGAWPVVAALQRNTLRLALLMWVTDAANVDVLRTQLFRWFDPEDETPKKLLVENHAGVQMYVYALCEELRLYGDPRQQQAFVATLVVDGDARWRAESAAVDPWHITASGQTHTVHNAGEDEAYPTYVLRPTNAGGSYAQRAWTPVVWRSENAGPQYPLRAELDTATIVTAGDMQADGDDLRVLVDGIEMDRWLDAMNTGATGIWFNADFARAPALTLKTQIAAAGDVASIEFNENVEVQFLPEGGILLIEDEAFVYTARDLTAWAVTGITRAAKGTAAALHAVGETAHWIQHDIYLLYDNPAATAPSVDDDYKPMFTLADSTNVSWKYHEFGDGNNKRAGRWVGGWGMITLGGGTGSLFGNSGRYTGTQHTLADPYTVAGAWLGSLNANSTGWLLENPCGIVNAAWADGQKRCVEFFSASLLYWSRGFSFWLEQAAIAAPAAGWGWENWSEAAAGADWDPAASIAIALTLYISDVEVGTVTVSLNASEVPVVTVNAAQGNYELDATLTNETTNEALTLQFVLSVDSELEVDTTLRTVTWLQDGSRQLQARALSSARRQWLRLLPGDNVLRFDDAATGNLTLTTTLVARYY